MKHIVFSTILIFTFCFVVFAQAKENQCPEIKFISPNQVIQPGESVIFEVKVGEDTEKYNLSYEWTFSKGKILRGQGTSRVEFFAAREDEGTNFEVSVKIIGLPKDCSDTYSDIYPVANLPIGEPVDRFGKLKTSDEYKARIDAFMISINQDPSYEGLILVALDKGDSRNYKIWGLKQIYKALIFRKYDLTRITFAISEANYEERISLWIVPPEAKYPTNAPDLDETIIKAEEFNQKINELFTKK